MSACRCSTHMARASLTGGLVLAALGIVISGPARASTMRPEPQAAPGTYIGHAGKVARVETRRLDRQYARPGLWQGATAQVECSSVSRLVDDCQATIQPPNSEASFWIDGTAYIRRDGHAFRVVWS